MELLNEATFSREKTKKMVNLMLKVLSKQIKKPLSSVEIPETYKNIYGYFMNYTSYFDGGNKALRINFSLKEKGDQIYSVDYFNKISVKPYKTIFLSNEINTLQVIGILKDFIFGKYESRSRFQDRLKEQRLDENFESWTTNSDANNIFINNPRNIVYQAYKQWAKTAGLARNIILNFDNFWIKGYQYINDNNLATKRIRPIRINPGVEDQVVMVDQGNSAAAQSFNDSLEIENEHLENFEFLEAELTLIKNSKHDKAKGVIIYGTPGIGKSYLVNKILGPDPGFVLKSGAIAGMTGLLQVLYENRTDKILVLDDNDQILKNRNAVNILKASCETPYRVTYTVRTESTQFMEDPTDPDEVLDLTTMGSDAGVGSYNNFVFESQLIIISNLYEVPGAIASRLTPFGFKLSTDQILDLIKTKLEAVEPDIALNEKEYMLEWLRQNQKFAGGMDFRLFKFCLTRYLSHKQNPKWETWLKIALKSGKLLKSGSS